MNKQIAGTAWFDLDNCDVIENHPDKVLITGKHNYIHQRIDGFFEQWGRNQVVDWVFRNQIKLSEAHERLLFPADAEI